MALIAVEGKDRFWRWNCVACGQNGRRWFHTRDEALDDGQEHARLHEPSS
jgi:hypothetical protein